MTRSVEIPEAALVPIAGEALRVGDVFLPTVDRRMKVDRITLVTRPGYPLDPMFAAHGHMVWMDGHETDNWQDYYYGNDWVVVER